MDKIYYCYSKRLQLFLRSMNESYVETGLNHSTNTKYWTFYKSDRLDDLIRLFNEIKHK